MFARKAHGNRLMTAMIGTTSLMRQSEGEPWRAERAGIGAGTDGDAARHSSRPWGR